MEMHGWGYLRDFYPHKEKRVGGRWLAQVGRTHNKGRPTAREEEERRGIINSLGDLNEITIATFHHLINHLPKPYAGGIYTTLMN